MPKKSHQQFSTMELRRFVDTWLTQHIWQNCQPPFDRNLPHRKATCTLNSFLSFLPLSFTVFLYFLLPPGRFSTCNSMTDRAHMNTSWSDFPYSPPPTDCNIYVESVRLQPVCAYVTIGYPHTQIELQGIKVIKYSLNRASHTPKYSRVI